MLSRGVYVNFATLVLISYSAASLWKFEPSIVSQTLVSAPVFKSEASGLATLFKADAAPTNLAATAIALQGVVLAISDRSSMIFTGSSGEVRVVSVGENIDARTLLKEVGSDHVWVEVDGKASRINLVDRPTRDSTTGNTQVGVRNIPTNFKKSNNAPRIRPVERSPDKDQTASETGESIEPNVKK